jgi:hypothetical protein
MCERCAPEGDLRAESEVLYDGHGMYLSRVCPACRKQTLAGFRPDIFEHYDTDELIEEDY